MYETILVPVDGSDASRTALRHAAGIATDLAARIHLLTVVGPTGSPLGFGVDEVDDLNRAIAAMADAAGSPPSGLKDSISTTIRRGEPVYEEILTYAGEIDADVIILGRQGASTLSDVLLGSTADRVARRSDIPVLLVPAAGTD